VARSDSPLPSDHLALFLEEKESTNAEIADTNELVTARFK
jgi:hypothetical protein